MTEDAAFVQYAENTDELVLVVLSVGDVAIDNFEATIRVTADGSDDILTVVIGPPISESDGGDAHAHRVRIPRFRATYGHGTRGVEAYLPQELGGDQWKGTVDILGGSTPPPVGGPGSVSYKVTDSKTGQPIETAKVTVAGKTTAGQSAGIFIEIPSGELPYSVKADGYLSDSGKILVAPGEDAKLIVGLELRKSKPPRRPAEPGVVSFEVIDTETRAPVTNARVVIGSQTSEGFGKGFLVNVPKGKQPYTVAAEGYLPITGKINVPAGGGAELKVELKPGETPAHETGSIEVALKWDGEGPPVDLKGFRVLHHGSAKMGVTDADGKVVLTNVPAGEGVSNIWATKEDFSAGGKTEVTVVPGETVSITIRVKEDEFYDPKEISVVDVTVRWDGEGSRPDMEGYRVWHLASATAGITDRNGTVRLKLQVGDGASLFSAISKDRSAGGEEVALIESGETNSVTILVSELEEVDDDDDPDLKKADVSVQVSDAVTNESIDSATIKIANEIAEETAITFLKVSLGEQPYHVTAPRYKPASGTVRVKAGTGAHLEIKLQPDGTADDEEDDVDVDPAVEKADVSVQVSDAATNESIDSATIKIANEIAEETAITFLTVSLGEQPYYVSAPRYKPASGTVHVKAGTGAHLEIKLQPEGTADDEEDDDNDNPIAQMGSLQILVTDRDSQETIHSATITVAGKQVLRKMTAVPIYAAPVGKHPFRVTADGYQPVTGTVTVQPVVIESLSVRLRRDDSP